MTASATNALPIFALRRWRGHTWWCFLATILFVAAVRLTSLGQNSLSHAEAARALDSWSTSLDRMRWYPPLQYALNWAVRHSTTGSETMLRLPNALVGVAGVVLLAYFTRKYVDAWSAVCVAAVAAVHAELIAYARLLKEFSIEALACVVMLWAGATAARKVSKHSFASFWICGLLAFAFSYTAPILVGGWFCAIVCAAWKMRRLEPWTRKYVIAMGVTFLLVCAGWYWWLSGAWNREAAAWEYGVRGGAWPEAYGLPVLGQWLVSQAYGAAQFLLGVASLYPPVDALIAAYSLLLAGASLATLRRCIPRFGTAAVAIGLLTVIAGAARLWPFGKFHTLLFAAPLVCLAVGCGLRRMGERFGASIPTLMLVFVCILNPAARAVKNIYRPTPIEHVRPTLAYVEQHGQKGDGVFAYYAAAWAVQYYWHGSWATSEQWRYKDFHVLAQPTSDRDQLKSFAARFADFMAARQRVWFVFTHEWQDERKEWMYYLSQQYELLDAFEVADASVHLFNATPNTE